MSKIKKKLQYGRFGVERYSESISCVNLLKKMCGRERNKKYRKNKSINGVYRDCLICCIAAGVYSLHEKRDDSSETILEMLNYITAKRRVRYIL